MIPHSLTWLLWIGTFVAVAAVVGGLVWAVDWLEKNKWI